MGKKTKGQKKNNQSIWVVAGIAVVAVAALIGFSLYSGGQRDAADENRTPTVKSDQERGAVRNVKGSPNAKVTLTEWNDYL